MEGEKPIALVDEIGSYTYDSSSYMAHIKTGKWHTSFSDGEVLPFKSVGKLTTCYEITDEQNLMYLYEKYYYALDDGSVNDSSSVDSEEENCEKFRQWLLNKPLPEGDSNAGQPYAEKTVTMYVNWLRRIKLDTGQSIFAITDIAIIDGFINHVPDNVFAETNGKQVPSALRKYKEFILENQNIDEDMGMLKNCLEIERKPRQNRIHPIDFIIYGAPGTGKTYSTAEYALAIIEDREVDMSQKSYEERLGVMKAYNDLIRKGQVAFTTFHQSYGYEEFIQGLRPDTTSDRMNFKVVDGVFKKIADKALNDLENNYVIIIDEINRANISKVFGELITLIEEDKRWGELNQLCATLQSGDVFAVPNNLYIVGTMNSADKSISLIDSALRRRFDFVEQKPEPSLISDDTLRKVFVTLNTRLASDLDSTDLLIGHSYFINKTADDLPSILNRNVIPLLYEYYYDNRKKVENALKEAIDGTNVSIVNEAMGRLSVKKNG